MAASVRVNSKGVYSVPSTKTSTYVNDLESTFTSDMTVSGELALQSRAEFSGSVTISNGQHVVSRVSGSHQGGITYFGGIPAAPSAGAAAGLHNSSSVLLVLSGAQGEGARNAILFFATGAHAYNDNEIDQGGRSGGGGQVGVHTLGPTGSAYLFFNGRQFMAKTQFGEFTLIATSSTQQTDGGQTM